MWLDPCCLRCRQSFLESLALLYCVLLSGIRIASGTNAASSFDSVDTFGLRGPGLYWLIPLGIERSVRVDLPPRRTVSAPNNRKQLRATV